MSEYRVKVVDSSDLKDLRHKVLFKGLPFDITDYNEDGSEEELHLALYQNEKMIGCMSLYAQNENYETGKLKYRRIRGMAVDKDYQGKGLGRVLLETSIKELQNSDYQYIWCNARLSAVPFYEKLGFEIYGEEFDIPKIGPHFNMKLYKK